MIFVPIPVTGFLRRMVPLNFDTFQCGKYMWLLHKTCEIHSAFLAHLLLFSPRNPSLCCFFTSDFHTHNLLSSRRFFQEQVASLTECLLGELHWLRDTQNITAFFFFNPTIIPRDHIHISCLSSPLMRFALFVSTVLRLCCAYFLICPLLFMTSLVLFIPSHIQAYAYMFKKQDI